MRDPKRAVAVRSRTHRIAAVLIGAASAVTLASCGGGDDDDNGNTPVTPPVTSNQPPASASQSVDGFIAFLKTVVPTKPETSEPLDVTGFVAPTNETGEPDPAV